MTKVPVYSSYDKGEQQGKNRVRTDYRISFDVSDKDWDDLEGQIEYTIHFLTDHYDHTTGHFGKKVEKARYLC